MSKVKVLEKVSFIMTVFKEFQSIESFLDSLFDQSVMPSEIIITDGGSTDGTVEAVTGYFKKHCRTFSQDRAGERIFEGITDDKIRLLLLLARGSKISQGRNTAIKNAAGDFICISDGGCIIGKDWFLEITRYYFSNPANKQGSEITGGYSFPFADSFFKACLAVCILPKKSEIRKSTFMPSSRNIGFTKNAWEKAGCYPENMDYGEDMKFNFNLISSGFLIRFNPQAEVYWNLRDNPPSVFKQFFRYAKGDAIGRMFPYRHAIRFVALLLLAAVIAASVIFSPYLLFLLFILLVIYCYKPYFRIDYFLKNSKCCPFIKNKKDYFTSRIKLVFLIPPMLIFIDVAKLSGYIYGLAVRKSKK